MGIKNTTDAVVLTSMKKVPVETVHHVAIAGDTSLAEPVLDMIAVMP
jgi:hypothetical protein